VAAPEVLKDETATCGPILILRVMIEAPEITERLAVLGQPALQELYDILRDREALEDAIASLVPAKTDGEFELRNLLMLCRDDAMARLEVLRALRDYMGV
jgi:hypothetical protein